MRKIVRKWFWTWDFDKEEEWLSQMAANGLGLCSVGFCRYEFEACAPGEYQYRLELLDHMTSHVESEQYLSFLEETGVKHVGTFGRWVFLRKKKDEGPFDLFSDNASRITHLNRILLLIGIAGGVNAFSGFSNVTLLLQGNPINAIGILNLMFACIALYGFYRIYMIKNRLQKEQQVFE